MRPSAIHGPHKMEAEPCHCIEGVSTTERHMTRKAYHDARCGDPSAHYSYIVLDETEQSKWTTAEAVSGRDVIDT
jgi:hypothetical protein